MSRAILRFQLLPMISLLSLLFVASACDVANEGNGDAGYPSNGWIDLDATGITSICPPASVEAGQPYDLLVKYQASCWGIDLNASCSAKLVGQAVKLSISYEKPNWASDCSYCEKEIRCTLPSLPKGDYAIEPQPYCAPGAVTLKVGMQASGAPVCSATSGC